MASTDESLPGSVLATAQAECELPRPGCEAALAEVGADAPEAVLDAETEACRGKVTITGCRDATACYPTQPYLVITCLVT